MNSRLEGGESGVDRCEPHKHAADAVEVQGQAGSLVPVGWWCEGPQSLTAALLRVALRDGTQEPVGAAETEVRQLPWRAR